MPVNGTYKKVFPGLPQEITHENFGIIAPVKGSLGVRNGAVDYSDQQPNPPGSEQGGGTPLQPKGFYNP